MTSSGLKLCIRTIVLAMFILLSTRVYSTNIVLSDTIKSDTSISADTIYLTGYVKVLKNITLTIPAGTIVLADSAGHLEVNGSLQALGNHADSIKFSALDTAVGWAGLYFYNINNSQHNDSSFIKYCIVEYVKNNPLLRGAISIRSSDIVAVTNCRISDNHADMTSGEGGAISVRNGGSLIKNNLLIRNKAYTGGALFCYSGNPEFTDNVIYKNTAVYLGGGMRVVNFAGSILRNYISNNQTTQSNGRGGGIAFTNFTSTSMVTGNCIVNNQSAEGGGVFCGVANNGGFFNNTICNNRASIHGGGMVLSGITTLTNNIIYGNTAISDSTTRSIVLSHINADPDFYYCNIEGDSSGFSGIGSGSEYLGDYSYNIDVQPIFRNPTMGAGVAFDGLAADWSIDSNNTAMINRGNPVTSGMSHTSKDIAGKTRIYNGRIDIGAYENQQPIIASCIINTNTLWDADTIRVKCNIIVKSGMTLTINSGTYIDFQGPYSINVKGNLLALGSADQRIIFSVLDTTSFHDPSSLYGGWKGIHFTSTSNTSDSSIFSYCNFSFAKGQNALFISSWSKIEVSNCLFSNNWSYSDGGAIKVSSASPVFKSNIICNNLAGAGFNGNRAGGGMAFYNSNSVLINNTIVNNYATLFNANIYLASSNLSLINNIIYGNNIHGIWFDPQSTATMYNNNINSFYLQGGIANTPTEYGTINSDPQFVAPTAGAGVDFDGIHANWAVYSESPTVNRGLANISSYGLPSTDMAGYVRVIGDTIDIGAIETQISRKFILQHPLATTLCLNSDVSLHTTVSIPMSYQWKKDSMDLVGETSATISITTVQELDSGYYYCAMTNAFGTIYTDSAFLNVRIPPTVDSNPIHDTVCKGESTLFNVSISGSHPIYYQWYNSNGQIPGNNDNYQINAVDANHVSIYHCVATNNCGSIQSNGASLVMNTHPSVTSIPTNYSVCENQSLTYSINASGTNPLSYQWYQNGNAIVNATNNTFNITSINTSDAGTYYCKTSNECGADSSNTSLLTVDSIPDIVSQSSNITVCVGQSVTISITASGTTPVSYQWYYNNVAVSGAINSFFTINSVQSTDAGAYYCIATNACGNDQSNNIAITVNEAPIIANQTSSAAVCSGLGSLFSVSANSTLSLNYQWHNGNGAITGATGNTYTASTADNYYCIVSNTCGSTPSNNMALTVNTAPSVTSQSSNTTACVGQSVFFTNSATGTLPISYQWYDNNGTISGAVNNFFILLSVDTMDAGSYYCKSTNNCGSDSTLNINLSVNSPVQIITQSDDSSRCMGESVSFSVYTNGTQPITYQWYSNSGAISGATGNTFQISTVNLSDAGYYYCVVTNVCGSAQSAYKNLTVHALPNVQLGNDTTFCLGGSVILSPGPGYSCIWNTGSINPQISCNSSDSYYAHVTDVNGCEGNSDSVTINVIQPYTNENLCIVGVDSSTQKNIVVWEKTINVGTVSYNIYKESTVSGVYNLIANRDFDSIAYMIDQSSNPVAKAARYKLSVLDSCGNESPLSAAHKTMHLTISAGLAGAWNLIWDKYEGFPVSTYRIWRADTSLQWVLIDSVQGSLWTYVDANPPSGGLYYRVEVMKSGGACNPSNSKDNTNYNTSRSNTANNGSVISPSLLVNFTAVPTSGIPPLTVNFTDETTNGATYWYWNFGDGYTTTQQSPTHIYDSVGIFHVTLTASNADGSSSYTKYGFINTTNVGISEFTFDNSISVYPNPYSGSTNITYNLDTEADVVIDVYNSIGVKIQQIIEEKQTNGSFNYKFSAKDLGYSAGIYYLKIRINENIYLKKLIEVR